MVASGTKELKATSAEKLCSDSALYCYVMLFLLGSYFYNVNDLGHEYDPIRFSS